MLAIRTVSQVHMMKDKSRELIKTTLRAREDVINRKTTR